MATYRKHANNDQWNAHRGTVADTTQAPHIQTLVRDQEAFDSLDLGTHLNLDYFYWNNCKVISWTRICKKSKIWHCKIYQKNQLQGY